MKLFVKLLWQQFLLRDPSNNATNIKLQKAFRYGENARQIGKLCNYCYNGGI